MHFLQYPKMSNNWKASFFRVGDRKAKKLYSMAHEMSVKTAVLLAPEVSSVAEPWNLSSFKVPFMFTHAGMPCYAIM